MESQAMQHHNSLQKAIDIAMWMNFKYRTQKRSYAVMQDKKSKQYYVVQQQGKKKTLNPLPTDYSGMSYQQIQDIRSELDPLHHWEEIMGMVSSVHGELLRFILSHNIPLERIIRYELAARGHDENHNWVGYDNAKDIWLK
ncbi:MAG: hypothetical protein PSV16_11550 [Flavobacterium sp.]|nr:hypothetical protein [Flavobacterium sp.]